MNLCKKGPLERVLYHQPAFVLDNRAKKLSPFKEKLRMILLNFPHFLGIFCHHLLPRAKTMKSYQFYVKFSTSPTSPIFHSKRYKRKIQMNKKRQNRQIEGKTKRQKDNDNKISTLPASATTLMLEITNNIFCILKLCQSIRIFE